MDAFVGSLKTAMDEYIHDPVGIPLLNAWVRVGAALPDITERMREAVELDNA